MRAWHAARLATFCTVSLKRRASLKEDAARPQLHTWWLVSSCTQILLTGLKSGSIPSSQCPGLMGPCVAEVLEGAGPLEAGLARSPTLELLYNSGVQALLLGDHEVAAAQLKVGPVCLGPGPFDPGILG